MEWYKIQIGSTVEDAYDTSDILQDLGCNGVEMIDPAEIASFIDELKTEEYASEDLIPKISEEMLIIGYLDTSYDIENIKNKLQGKNIEISIVDDSSWENNWKKYYHEFNVGEKICICPSWETPKAPGKRQVIYLDPGMAFGTGEHETTFMCTQMIESNIKNDYRVLDVGTGSGILSIVAAKLGASYVKAVDVDDVAVRVAKENIKTNIRSDIISVEKKEIKDLEEIEYDIVVANIVSKVLIDIKEEIKKRVKKGGTVILSGIIKEKYPLILENYISLGFELKSKVTKKEWVTVVFNA